VHLIVIVAKDCPWLSNSTLTVILILLHHMTEHVVGPYWWRCTASALLMEMEMHSKCLIDGDAQQVPYWWRCTAGALLMEMHSKCLIDGDGDAQQVPYWWRWRCTASALLMEMHSKCLVTVMGSVTESLYLIWSVMEI